MLLKKIVLQPGEWEGIHSHSGNHVDNADRRPANRTGRGDQETTSVSAAGSVGWQCAADLSEERESGKSRDAPIEFLWMNLKL